MLNEVKSIGTFLVIDPEKLKSKESYVKVLCQAAKRAQRSTDNSGSCIILDPEDNSNTFIVLHKIKKVVASPGLSIWSNTDVLLKYQPDYSDCIKLASKERRIRKALEPFGLAEKDDLVSTLLDLFNN